MNSTRYNSHLFRIFTLSALIATPILVPGLTTAYAHTVPKSAINLYNAGLAIKSSNPKKALTDFQKAAKIAPFWESPVYQIGVMLARQNFNLALPWYLKALKINPQDNSIWNMIGWGYYQEKLYSKAVSAFQNQLHLSPNNPYAIWGLANCYGNSQVRSYAKARQYLQSLLHSSEKTSAQKMLSSLPPNSVDASYQAAQPITYEDAIAMALSYRIGVTASYTSTLQALNGKGPSADVASYVGYAASHGLLNSLSIPSFQAPATRLFLALFLAKLYGVNQFDYLRPFPLTDMTSVPVNEQMVVNSILAMGLMTEQGNQQFQPNATMTRAHFSVLVNNDNQVMKNPPGPTKWLTPPAPAPTPAQLIFFRTGSPDIPTQENDFSQHIGQISGIAFTDFPFIADTTPTVQTIREKIDTTQYIFTPQSAGSDVPNEISMAAADGMNPYMVLSNFNYNNDTSNPQIVDKYLSDPSQSQALASEVVQVAKSEQMAGIAVDYENVWTKDKNALVSFVQNLKQDLSGTTIKLMVCLPEQQTDNPQSAYDYKALGHLADLVMLITYDEHTQGSQPGPIANFSNVSRTVQYAVQNIPANKILLGLADYGYDWSGGSGQQIDMATAYSLASTYHSTIEWDPVTASSHFTYTDSSGAQHIVYFESGKSISALAKLVPTYGLGGYAVWYLGAENSNFWNGLSPFLPPVK